MLFAAKERVALAAYLNLECRLSGTYFKGIAARTDHLGIIIVFGMYFLFHATALVGVLNRIDTNLSLILIRPAEFHFAIDKREDGVILAQPHILAGMDVGASLAHQNIASQYRLAIELLDAEPFGLAIPAESTAAACFLMRHVEPPLVCYNLVNRQSRVRLPMPPFATITNLGFVLEYDDFLVPILTEDGRLDLGPFDPGLTHRYLVVIGNHQHVIQLDLTPLISREFLHIDHLARRYPILLSSGIDNGVNRLPP